tara:strand:+ start:570 stop:911 length:342 start_codon:yes stop_codon:yes gene_type:complete
MSLESAKYTRMHNKTGSELTAMENAFNNSKQIDLTDFPAEGAMIYQIQKMQEELDYLRTQILNNKNKVSFEGPATTLSFGDMITTTTRGRTTYTIVLTATKAGVSKSTTLTLT